MNAPVTQSDRTIQPTRKHTDVYVLVLNCGSSSVKYKLIEMPSETVLLQGNEKRYMDQPLKEMMDAIFEKINYRVDIDAHRVVHGADLFDSSVLVSNEVMERIESISYLAPLHNPINLEGIHLAQQKV